MSDFYIFENLKSEVPILNFLDYRRYLQALYHQMHQYQKNYSYLKFAEDFGFSRTNVLHLIIRGKRPLTLKSADRIVQTLSMKGADKRYFLLLVAHQNSRKPAEREQLFQQLIDIKSQSLTSQQNRAMLEFFSEWYHAVIYELCSTSEFKSEPKWIAAQLQPCIRVDEARKSLQLLESLGLIAFDKSQGRHVPTQSRISTGDEIASVAVTRYHHRMIDLGKRSLTDTKDELRDISSIAIAIPSSRIQQYKMAVSRFRKEILAIADQESEHSDRVYQMNIQWFPVTKKLED